MKTIWLIVISAMLTGTTEAVLTSNRWQVGDGKWEDGANWTQGVPSSDDAVNIIGSIFSSTTTVDTATVTQHVINGCMTISNLVVGGALGIPHLLFLKNANNTPGNIDLRILNDFTITSGGSLSVTNSDLRVSPSCGAFSIDGSVLLISGMVNATNSCGGLIRVGNTGQGTLTVSNGTLIAHSVAVADGVGSRGTLTIAGGTNRFVFLSTGLQVGTTGTVWLTGGQLTVSNETTVVGGDGVGQMTVSNGTWAGSLVTVGNLGTLTIAGGTNKVSWLQLAAGAAGTTGTVWMTGGSLAVTNNTNFGGITNNPTLVGVNGVGQMTVSNGTFLAREMYVGTNTGSVGTFTVAGGTNTLTSLLSVGGLPGATGAVWITGGLLVITNNDTTVGFSGVGQVTISNGTWRTSAMVVGRNAGSRGTLAIAGGTNIVSSLFIIGFLPGATGDVWMTGGQLFATNIAINIGAAGVGQMTVSNGTFRSEATFVGNAAGGRGTLNVAGGTNTVTAEFVIGVNAGATGAVWVTDGQLTSTNNDTDVGRTGIGQLTVSNGTWQARNVNVGHNAGSSGSLTIAGGTSTISSNLILGICGSATGSVTIAGGTLYVTNAAHNARLEVRNGTLTINSGTLIVDRIDMSSPCAHFVRTGGTFYYGGNTFIAGDDTDGDGLSNGEESSNGLDMYDPFDAARDDDGDGFTNAQEVKAGTLWYDANSSLRITSISQTNNDLRITWMMGSGKTNALERTAGVGGSFATNNFTAIFTVTNTTGTVTNYLDVGAATNVPSLFYRVRLVP